MTVAASLRAVEKRYPDFHLGPISFGLAPGRVRALIGPNGAGKSTAMDVLAGISRPCPGAGRVWGGEGRVGDPEGKGQLRFPREHHTQKENR